MQALFGSMIVTGWAAFEALAGDLWEHCLNVHPHTWSDLKGSKSRIAEKSAGRLPKINQEDAQNRTDRT